MGVNWTHVLPEGDGYILAVGSDPEPCEDLSIAIRVALGYRDDVFITPQEAGLLVAALMDAIRKSAEREMKK